MSSDGSESCQDDGGVSSTCEDYDKLVQCNDGICAVDEICTCSECSAFCISGDLTPALVSALTPITFNEPGMGDACEASNLYEFANWGCPDWSSVSGFENKQNPLCDEMGAMREFYAELYNMAKKWAEEIQEEYSCVPNDERTVCEVRGRLLQAADDFYQKFEYYNSLPCHLDL
jgi:hypothetical protein